MSVPRRADPPPVDPEPEDGDLVIELIDGVPHVYTHAEKPRRPALKGSGGTVVELSDWDPARHPRIPKGSPHGGEFTFFGIVGETSHTDLLRMRKEARAALPAGHPERLKAERAVRQSRKKRTAEHEGRVTAEQAGTSGMAGAMQERRAQQNPELVQRYRGMSRDELLAQKTRRGATDTERKLVDRELARRKLGMGGDEPDFAARTEEPWKTSGQAQREREQAERKHQQDLSDIAHAGEYFSNYDPNYDPSREDVSQPLWHGLQSAIDNANDTVDESKRGSLPISGIPMEVDDPQYVSYVQGAFNEGSPETYPVTVPVTIKEAAERMRRIYAGESPEAVAGHRKLTEAEDRSIATSVTVRADELGSETEARQQIAEEQGLPVGEVSRAIDREAHRKKYPQTITSQLKETGVEPRGVHPSEIQAGDPTKMESYSRVSSQQARRGVRPIRQTETVSLLTYGKKHVGRIGTLESGRGTFDRGNQTHDLSGPTHAANVEEARGIAAASINAAKIRSALNSAGFSASTSHTTRVRGWKNYTSGYHVQAGRKSVGITHTFSSGRPQGYEEKRSEKLSAYAEALRKAGFHVTVERTPDGLIESVSVDNSRQGKAGA